MEQVSPVLELPCRICGEPCKVTTPNLPEWVEHWGCVIRRDELTRELKRALTAQVTAMNERNLPELLRAAERRVNQHVWGDRRAIVSIPARPDEDVDLLLMEAAGTIERLSTYAEHKRHCNAWPYKLMLDGFASDPKDCTCGLTPSVGDGNG